MRSELVGTYRLQLSPEFGFRDACAVVPYLRALGVSHLYLSPCFEASPGSTHGYDVVDPNRLRDELGGEEAFRELVDTAQRAGLGIVLDIVPHHMAAVAGNDWWWSVLELGQDSPYAAHFDIDWDPSEQRLRGMVVLPVLGDHYGRVLEAGELRLARSESGDVIVRYHDHTAPLSPDSADELWAAAGRRGCGIDDVLAEINADLDRLDELLNRQHHRFMRWQAAAHDLDYRRFFDIDSLVALRSERPAVFDDTHRLVTRLVTGGAVDGVRVDHIDGLRDPEGYLARLRATAQGAWIAVEKILRPEEPLPATWSADGTTGYEFLALVSNLLLDAGGVEQLIDGYSKFTDGASTYGDVRLAARREVLRDSLDADLERVVAVFVHVCERHRQWRDFTRAELREALGEACVHTSTYRAYVRPGIDPTEEDQRRVNRSIEDAATARPDLDAELWVLIRRLLLGELVGDFEAEAVARFQQLTGPVAAKGEEDTAFYRWAPLLTLNEVGAEPDWYRTNVDDFHLANAARQQHWPLSMLTTSTHDTKRSEDVRARLSVLSDMPDEWLSAVQRWRTLNERHRDDDLDAPDPVDEWFIYQTLVGAHPLPFERAWPVVEKSLREAKRHTSWIRVDANYEGAVREFLLAITNDHAFRADLDEFVEQLAEPGWINSLSQVALRTLSPGIPDTYQGCELWDLSLVDPDNRRPVDFAARGQAVEAIDTAPAQEMWMDQRDTGLPKLALLRACLQLRRDRPQAFGREGTYDPIAVSGTGASRVVAFSRGGQVALAAPLHPSQGLPDDAVVALPNGEWTNVLTQERHTGEVSFGQLRDGFPLAVLAVDLDPVL